MPIAYERFTALAARNPMPPLTSLASKSQQSHLNRSNPRRTRRRLAPAANHSHSMVPGGFEVTSYTTRLTPFTSFTMRVEMIFSTS